MKQPTNFLQLQLLVGAEVEAIALKIWPLCDLARSGRGSILHLTKKPFQHKQDTVYGL